MKEDLKDYITLEEVENEHFINLYRQDLLGLWTAYGVSAYLSMCLAELNTCFFSQEMQMPLTLVDEEDLSYLSQKCEQVYRNLFYCQLLSPEENYDRQDYAGWVSRLRKESMPQPSSV